jgi:peptidoglycan/LPS O-acetylase OafA/YrhL
MKDSPNLDLLRAIAVALVVASHVVLISGVDCAWYDLHTMGRIGVALFFVHTTLVLMASLERHRESAIQFFVRRFFRIYPLSIAAVVFIAMLQMVGGVPINAGQLVSNLLLVQNVTGYDSTPSPLWTLPYEIQMYLVLPAVFMISRTQRPVQWTLLLLAASVVAAEALGAKMDPPMGTGAKLVRFVPCFLPGLLAFVLPRRTASPWALFSVVSASIVVVPALVAAGFSELHSMWVICLCVGMTIPACREITSIPLARSAKLVATYSYGVYVTHDFAIGVLAGGGLLPGPWYVQWGAFLILLPGLAYIAYHGIEKRGIAVGNRVALSLSSKQTPPALLSQAR